MFKTALILMVLAMVTALFYGFFAMKKNDGPALVRALFWRVALGLAILALVIIGLATGELAARAPWDAGPQQPATQQEATPSGQ